MTPYQHGGDITAFARLCGCETSEVIDLSSNINFVKPHIEVDFNTLSIAPYPDYRTLYGTIASYYDVRVEEMELFNGGSSAIFALLRHLRHALSHCTIYSPAYLEYKKAARCFGYEITHIDRLTRMDEKVRERSLVVFVNPSTPDGHFYEIEPLLQMWQSQRCTVLVDESFIEFTPYASVSELLGDYPNLYILKSMTKFFGAAGIRIGTLISHARNIEALKVTEPMWKLSAFDSAYIAAALKDHSFKARSDAANKQSRAYLSTILTQSPPIRHHYPTTANYILAELEGITAGQLQQKLLPHRVMVRNCENFDALGASHVRIAVKSMDDLARFKEALHA